MVGSASFGLVLFAGLLVAGVPIYVSLIGAAALLTVLDGGPIAGIGQFLLDQLNSGTLMALPFFVLAAVFQGGGVARSLMNMAASWVGWLPGGIPIATLLATGLFAAINGSSVATALAMGTLVVPEMQSRGYSRRFAVGLTAAAGTLGILFPPSLMMVLYGLVAETSIPRLFLAGIVPGLLQMALFVVVILLTARRHGGRAEPFAGWANFGRANARALPGLLVPIIVLGGIYGGVVTLTEASALAAVVALLVSWLGYRAVRLGQIPSMLVDGMTRTSSVLVIVAGATLLSHWLTRTGLPGQLVAWVGAMHLGRWQFLLLMELILLLLGAMLEGTAIILISVPLTLPILDALGIDRVHYAIIIGITIELAMLHPPVGINLYVMSEISKAPVAEVIMGVLPFLVATIGLLLLVTFMPDLATALPNLVLGVPR